MLGNTLTQHVNIRESNFNLPKCSFSIHQSSVHTIEKFKLIGKIMLFICYLSGLVNTLRCTPYGPVRALPVRALPENHLC